MIGLHVRGVNHPFVKELECIRWASRLQKKVRDYGVRETVRAIIKRITGSAVQDEHIWHPTYAQLMDLVKAAHFEIEKVHWQKPPFDHVVYLMLRKL